ncbi:OLC1v1030901C1 [Oldenlandia corymbosa var. corymbosa]|uniref:OLC1v1030901C1 n=1 Tax=Oldenlandia corymbosa var. corymbosa TaxID=529605 RepID=A0AAV1CH59_OLDCO|nr:OLC1v1030901C1 [Oldenlandia corymbosa var. corymbosa]
MLDDRIRLQGSNFTDVQTLERLKKPSSAASPDEQPEAESQEDTQRNPNTQQDLAVLYEKFYQLIITMSKTVLDIREKEMELKIEPDEQAKQTIKILTDAMGLGQLSQTNDEASLPVGKSVPTSKEVVVDEQQTQPQGAQGLDQLSQKMMRLLFQWGNPCLLQKKWWLMNNKLNHKEKNTQEDITGSVDLDKDVNETIEAEEYLVPSALDETKNPTPSINEIIRRASAPASESLSGTKKLEMIAAVAEQVEKNPKVVEAVPLSIIPPDWNIASTTGGLLMLDKNECTTPPPVISKKADVLNEGLTKTVEKNFLFEFGKIIWTDRTAFYSMREGAWIENSIIDAWAVILNKEEAKSDSPRWIFFGVSSFFQFFQSYVECMFPHIELVTAQYTLTEVTLPSHKDKTPTVEDCGIYTMHQMERYDGGEYEDGTTLNFNTGNIKEYRWKYMIKILMHPANKNKDKFLEAMHQFYANTAEEEQKEIPDHIDLSSKSYYNDRKIQGWVK